MPPNISHQIDVETDREVGYLKVYILPLQCSGTLRQRLIKDRHLKDAIPN
jgi:hypothetical protein